MVGGAAVTEEFHPGFRNSVASYTVSLLNPKIIRDLDLHGHGLTHRRAPRAELPAAPGRALSPRRRGPHQGRDREVQQPRRRALRRLRGGARAHRRRAARPRPRGAAERGRGLVGAQPRRSSCGRRRSATGCGGCRMAERRALLDLFTKSAADYLDGWFEAEPVKALFGFDAVVGNYASPYTPGTAYVHAPPRLRRGERQEGRLGPRASAAWARSRDAIAARRARRGRRDRDRRAGARGHRREGHAPPASCSRTGARSAPRAVAANVNPKLLYDRLVPEDALAGRLRARAWRAGAAAPAPSA